MESIKINNKLVKKLSNRSVGVECQEGQKHQHIFILGSKGIPASYGGFETFVEKLTEYRLSEKIHYHIARMAEDWLCYQYNDAECFDIKTPQIGAARAVWYDVAALYISIRLCQKNSGVKQPVFYMLTCRIGPFIGFLKKRIERLGGRLYLNPDGHEWKRSKWNMLIRRYWKLSERLMVKHADLVICDSVHIKEYIEKEYTKYQPKTMFIAYGADRTPSILGEEGKYADWLQKNGLVKGEYYLAVSRFVPENNFETMIREFMKTDSSRDFAIITTDNTPFYKKLQKKLHFIEDKRIKFIDTVYDVELLKKIRENAYAYIHGHEVGGTNPSLLESLWCTDMNLLLDVGFNREVAQESTLYWTKDGGSLAALIEKADGLERTKISEMGRMAKERVREAYQWEDIVKKYEDIFLHHDMRSI